MLMPDQAELAYQAGAAEFEAEILPNSGESGRLGGENGDNNADGFGNDTEKNQDGKIRLTPATKEIKTLLENAGLHQAKIDEIVNMPKGQKPFVTSYLSQKYIDSHLREFRESGVVKILSSKPKGTIGRKDGTFVLSGKELHKIIKNADGNISKIETVLGIPNGYLGKNPVVVIFDQYSGLRMSQGNELGADPQYWMPGGYTSGGVKEAIIDAAPEGTYSYYNLF